MTEQPIVDPAAPLWVRPLIDGKVSVTAGVMALTMIFLLIVAVTLAYLGPLPLRVLGGLIGAAQLAGLFVGVSRATKQSVTPGEWKYKGQPIVGQARAALVEAATLADEAKSFVAAIPTKLSWEQFRPHVEALLWDAAGHAADVCKLNEQLNKLRHAEPGTPQGEVYADLVRRRADHLAVVERARDEIGAVAAAAGNAAAAAQLALERSGSVHDLEIVSPSAPALIARGGLDEAQTQLELLAEAWTEVDASQFSPPARRGPRARRSQPPTDQQQEG
ncbi:MAG TPA: hypothetical protein VFB78_13890 [Acidimicrobiales bacterium]|nr:hypothetical protein [Acidimicrobiales bacterium]